MSIAFRNGYEAFIYKNISQILTNEGYDAAAVNRASDFAIGVYRNTASFGKGRGGDCFDYCLSRARQLLSPSKKKKRTSRKK